MIRPSASNWSRRWVWFALCIFTMSACMPTLASWVAPWRASPSWAQVCSVNGARWVNLTPDQALGNQGETEPGVNSGGHCPFCLLQEHSPALPVNPVASALERLSLPELVPALLLRAPSPMHAWSPLSARAPPQAA